MWRFLLLIGLVGLVLLSFTRKKADNCFDDSTIKIKGFSLTAPAKPFPEDPMPSITAVNGEWIAAIPYAFTPGDKPVVMFGSDWQWWGETPKGIRETIKIAKANNLKVMVKPQIWMRGNYTGAMDYEKETDWQAWFQSYREYILLFAELSEEEGAEMLCIGTEFKICATKHPSKWRALIAEIRERYSGPLVYAANWDEYDQITFWDALDYIGVNAYFPLVEEATPTVAALKKAWKKPFEKMKSVACNYDRPIIFTEYGYLSVDGCAYKTWELEKKVNSVAINEQAQANALQALMEIHWNENWWAGGFMWKWFPNIESKRNFPKWEYTTQGKQGELIMKEWYGK
ncbi:MAG: hypothetical protein AAF598_01045 [Bacteroidota bacterium]